MRRLALAVVLAVGMLFPAAANAQEQETESTETPSAVLEVTAVEEERGLQWTLGDVEAEFVLLPTIKGMDEWGTSLRIMNPFVQLGVEYPMTAEIYRDRDALTE